MYFCEDLSEIMTSWLILWIRTALQFKFFFERYFQDNLITVSKDENCLAPEKGAEGDGKTVELDHDEPARINGEKIDLFRKLLSTLKIRLN